MLRGRRSPKPHGSIRRSISRERRTSGSWSGRLTKRRSMPTLQLGAMEMPRCCAHAYEAPTSPSQSDPDRAPPCHRKPQLLNLAGFGDLTPAIAQACVLKSERREMGRRCGTRRIAGYRRSVDRCRGLPARPRPEDELREEDRGGVRPLGLDQTSDGHPTEEYGVVLARRPANVAQGVKCWELAQSAPAGSRSAQYRAMPIASQDLCKAALLGAPDDQWSAGHKHTVICWQKQPGKMALTCAAACLLTPPSQRAGNRLQPRRVDGVEL
jgi:hypothetical protein